jgi:hypothetical protein
MELKKLAAKPQLKKLILDDEITLSEYGEPLEFYIYDRQPVSTFVKIASLSTNDIGDIVELVNTLILDADANPVVVDGFILPQKLYVRVIEKVVKELGE